MSLLSINATSNTQKANAVLGTNFDYIVPCNSFIGDSSVCGGYNHGGNTVVISSNAMPQKIVNSNGVVEAYQDYLKSKTNLNGGIFSTLDEISTVKQGLGTSIVDTATEVVASINNLSQTMQGVLNKEQNQNSAQSQSANEAVETVAPENNESFIQKMIKGATIKGATEWFSFK